MNTSARRGKKKLVKALPDATEIEASLRKHALFAGVKVAVWQQLVERARLQRVEAQVNVLLQGEHTTAIYIVLSGTLKVYCPTRSGTDVVLAICGAGELLGEIGAVDGQLPSANVVTLEESVLMTIEREVFLECLRTTPELSMNLSVYAMRRLRAATAHIQLLSRLSAAGRIAAQLLVFADHYGIAAPANSPNEISTTPEVAKTMSRRIVIPLRIIQSDLGDLTAVSRVSVNKVLNKLRHDGVIAFDEAHIITICNRDALVARCQ